jgi:hypothetical protein
MFFSEKNACFDKKLQQFMLKKQAEENRHVLLMVGKKRS